MKESEFNIEEEERMLVLARFKTLNPESKILLGGDQEVSVKEIINHVENNDEFGKNIIKVQMKMFKILSNPLR